MTAPFIWARDHTRGEQKQLVKASLAEGIPGEMPPPTLADWRGPSATRSGFFNVRRNFQGTRNKSGCMGLRVSWTKSSKCILSALDRLAA